MHHLAILDRKRMLLGKILSGQKTIESRWYKHRRIPWNAVKAGDIIYFKDSGMPVTAKAKVSRVLFYEDLDKGTVVGILQRYARHIGIDPIYTPYYHDRRYCILMFLEDACKIQPFDIDKSGFGNACAWITVDDIRSLRRRSLL